MELHRANGGYETPDGRYRVERQDGLTECEHSMCDTLHRRFHEGRGQDRVHYVEYPAWHVWDVVKDDYATDGPEEFGTKREATEWLERHLTRSA